FGIVATGAGRRLRPHQGGHSLVWLATHGHTVRLLSTIARAASEQPRVGRLLLQRMEFVHAAPEERSGLHTQPRFTDSVVNAFVAKGVGAFFGFNRKN